MDTRLWRVFFDVPANTRSVTFEVDHLIDERYKINKPKMHLITIEKLEE